MNIYMLTHTYYAGIHTVLNTRRHAADTPTVRVYANVPAYILIYIHTVYYTELDDMRQNSPPM